jgi:hypothetical protein
MLERSYRRLIARAGGDGAVDDVVHGPGGDPRVEEVAQRFDHAARRAMADQHQAQDPLPQPGLGDRQVKEDLVGSRGRSAGVAERPLGSVSLSREELPADGVPSGQLGD